MKSTKSIFYLKGDIQMNTCLSTLYLKICKIDARYIRFALMILAFAGSGGMILGVPIHGDVGS
jgi:hypothetical protein